MGGRDGDVGVGVGGGSSMVVPVNLDFKGGRRSGIRKRRKVGVESEVAG